MRKKKKVRKSQSEQETFDEHFFVLKRKENVRVQFRTDRRRADHQEYGGKIKLSRKRERSRAMSSRDEEKLVQSGCQVPWGVETREKASV